MNHTPARPKLDAIALSLTMTGPAVAALFYFVFLHGETLPRVIYGGSKLLLFMFPLVWVWGVERNVPPFPRPNLGGQIWGIGFGILVAGVMLGLYYGFLRGWLDVSKISEKARSMGVSDYFVPFAALISLGNSAAEEYYWRWFVFGHCRRYTTLPLAAAFSGVAFSAHHFVVLCCFFNVAFAAFLAFAIAVGGAVWAWLYESSGSIYVPWISHVIVDIAIMTVGYDTLSVG